MPEDEGEAQNKQIHKNFMSNWIEFFSINETIKNDQNERRKQISGWAMM